AGGVHQVVAAEGVHRQVVDRLGVEDADSGRQPAHVHHGGTDGRSPDGDVVVPVGAVDDHGVGLTVGGVDVGGGPEGQVDHAHAGAGQVVDRDGVGAAQGNDVDHLQAVQVHRPLADVAGEPRPLAVRREGDVLVRVIAPEDLLVVAGLALDRVVAVARFPDERVVPGASTEHVVPGTPEEDIVA